MLEADEVGAAAGAAAGAVVVGTALGLQSLPDTDLNSALSANNSLTAASTTAFSDFFVFRSRTLSPAALIWEFKLSTLEADEVGAAEVVGTKLGLQSFPDTDLNSALRANNSLTATSISAFAAFLVFRSRTLSPATLI